MVEIIHWLRTLKSRKWKFIMITLESVNGVISQLITMCVEEAMRESEMNEIESLEFSLHREEEKSNEFTYYGQNSKRKSKPPVQKKK